MRQPILVTGGNGTLGRGVVARLLDAGHEVRVLSRHPRPAGVPAGMGWVTGELLSGEGLADAVAGVAAVVHCAGDPRRPRVDVDGTRNLLQTARAAGTPHLVYISIVGIDQVPYRYYQAKLQAERLIQASGLPWTILRATQFHQLILLVAGLPSGQLPDMGGPHIRSAADLLRAYLHAAGQRRLVLPIRLSGATFAGYRRGGHLTPDRAVGRRTWEEFLAEQVSRPGWSRAHRTIAEGRT
jgi:uncharacterized protein YbjT (DUF2867 family)